MRGTSSLPWARPARAQAGFTLVELLLVLVILGILIAIGTTAFLSMRDRSQTSAAEMNVREAQNAAELYFADNETYHGMSVSELASFDAGVRLSREPVVSADGKRFCLESTHNGRSPSATPQPGLSTHSLHGPGGRVEPGACPASL